MIDVMVEIVVDAFIIAGAWHLTGLASRAWRARRLRGRHMRRD